jgi:hypothetical protein
LRHSSASKFLKPLAALASAHLYWPDESAVPLTSASLAACTPSLAAAASFLLPLLAVGATVSPPLLPSVLPGLPPVLLVLPASPGMVALLPTVSPLLGGLLLPGSALPLLLMSPLMLGLLGLLSLLPLLGSLLPLLGSLLPASPLLPLVPPLLGSIRRGKADRTLLPLPVSSVPSATEGAPCLCRTTADEALTEKAFVATSPDGTALNAISRWSLRIQKHRTIQKN